jgi:hypothetical protein
MLLNESMMQITAMPIVTMRNIGRYRAMGRGRDVPDAFVRPGTIQYRSAE